MKMRQIPFGYAIRDGQHVANENEAAVVRKIFQLRANGITYNEIVAELQQGDVPYDETMESWNKNNIARILSHSERYMGKDKWPKILDEETALKSMAVHAIKTERKSERVNIEQAVLWSLLHCPDCGGRLLRASGRAAKSGKLILRCERVDCGCKVHTTQDALILNVQMQLEMDKAKEMQCPACSAEILLRQNELTRASTTGVPFSEFKAKVFALISAQYDALNRPRIPIKYKEESNGQNRSAEIDWSIFGRAVSAVYVEQSGEVRIQYTEQE